MDWSVCLVIVMVISVQDSWERPGNGREVPGMEGDSLMYLEREDVIVYLIYTMAGVEELSWIGDITTGENILKACISEG